MPESKIQARTFLTSLEENYWVATQILEKIENGLNPKEIAIISRKHASLEEIAKVLQYFQVPINYDRHRDVLGEPHISEIIEILRFTSSLNNLDGLGSQELLPEILSYPFLEIPPLTIYQISLEAWRNQKTWLETMLVWPEKKVLDLANFLLELAKINKSESVEKVLDILMGVEMNKYLAQSESESDLDDLETQDPQTKFISPYKKFYFDRLLETDKPKYLNLLSSLRTFVQAIRDYRARELIYVSDLLEFVDLRQSSKLNLSDTSQIQTQKNAVSLLTAHKAKGLEFDTVFILNCYKEHWNGKPKANKVGLPTNLNLLAQKDNYDDALRLFYVAVTRAKINLYLTTHQQLENGKKLTELDFLQDIVEFTTVSENSENQKLKSLQIWLDTSSKNNSALSSDQRELLNSVLEGYKLSVTHLNNFLDLTQGGPQRFLEQNLLRFPQAKSNSARYGTAAHSAIARFYQNFSQTKALPELNYLLSAYEQSLKVQRMNSLDYSEFLEKGQKYLQNYYNDQKNNFDSTDIIEFDFNHQGVALGEALITGKIDKMSLDKSTNEITVIDWKTGKPQDKWSGSNEYGKIKMANYHRQLVFYKLLVENSREYSHKYQVNNGKLEFLEPSKDTERISILETQIPQNDAIELTRLIQAVYKRILNQDFDLKNLYSEGFEGNQEFIAELLSQG